jgi:hypothetical protein
LPEEHRLKQTSRCVRVTVGASIVLLYAGCYPITELQTPRTTPVHRIMVAGAIATPRDPSNSLVPAFDLSVRYGLTDRIDIGARVRPAAFEFGAKVQLLRDELELSFAPSFLAAIDTAWHINDDDIITANDNVSVVAGRLSLYVGSSEDARVSVFGAPTVDLGTRRFQHASGNSRELLIAPGFLAGIVFALGPHLPRFMISGGVLFGVGGHNVASGNLEDQINSQTVLGPGDKRFEFNFAVLYVP